MQRQQNAHKNKDTCKNFLFLSIGNIVAVQKENSCPWTHGTMAGLDERTTVADPTRSG